MENIVYALIGHFYITDKTANGTELIGIFKTKEGAQKMAKWIGEHDDTDVPYHYYRFEIRENLVLD